MTSLIGTLTNRSFYVISYQSVIFIDGELV